MKIKSARAKGLTLVGPAFLYALLMLGAPLVLILGTSLWSQTYLEIDTTFHLGNYREVWTDPLYRTLLLRSLIISASVTLVTIVLAFPMAYFMSFYVPENRKYLWVLLITLPFWTSYLIRIFLWKVILGYNGVVNGSLMGLGIIEEPLTFILYNLNAVVLTLSHAWLPFAILPIFVSLERIDRPLLEAAKDLGDGPLALFRRIILPLAMPGITVAALLVFIPTIGDYVTPRLVGGPNGLMIANIIEVQFKKANNAPLGAAIAISTMFIMTVISFAFVTLSRRYFGGRN